MNNQKVKYKLIDCGGKCGGCIALVRNGIVIVGPPFHPRCGCGLTKSMIDAAESHESNLNQDVSSNRNCDPKDVKWLKNALKFLGFYKTDIRAGETDEILNEYPNQNLFDAIHEFQNKYKLDEHDGIKPGYQTEAKLNQEIEKKNQEQIGPATFDTKIDTLPGQYAKFDGKNLTVYQNDKPIASWNAVSGKPGYQTFEYQDKKDTGPIPEGTYVAQKKDFQNRDDYGPIKKYTSWPGGEYGWGKYRVWIEPSKETKTYGRKGFAIHGGAEPGSAGCIDLTSQMDDFTKWFKNNGHDLIVKVEY